MCTVCYLRGVALGELTSGLLHRPRAPRRFAKSQTRVDPPLPAAAAPTTPFRRRSDRRRDHDLPAVVILGQRTEGNRDAGVGSVAKCGEPGSREGENGDGMDIAPHFFQLFRVADGGRSVSGFLGCAFAIAPDGGLLTCRHVVDQPL
jgi:hypothetical protein